MRHEATSDRCVRRCCKTPRASGFRRLATLGRNLSLRVGGIWHNARLLHGPGSLGTCRHAARLFESHQRFGFQIELGPRVFPILGHRNSATCGGHSYVAGSAMSVRCTTQEPSTTAGALFYRWLSLRPTISSYWCIMSEQTLRVVPRKNAVSTQRVVTRKCFSRRIP